MEKINFFLFILFFGNEAVSAQFANQLTYERLGKFVQKNKHWNGYHRFDYEQCHKDLLLNLSPSIRDTFGYQCLSVPFEVDTFICLFPYKKLLIGESYKNIYYKGVIGNINGLDRNVPRKRKIFIITEDANFSMILTQQGTILEINILDDSLKLQYNFFKQGLKKNRFYVRYNYTLQGKEYQCFLKNIEWKDFLKRNIIFNEFDFFNTTEVLEIGIYDHSLHGCSH